MVHVVAGRAIETECHVLRAAFRLAQQLDRETPADMRRIEQRAIGAVVDVQLITTTLFDAHHDRAIFGAQGTAGLAPQLGRIADRQRFERTVDRLEIALERGRLHARIGRGEPAADIDHVDRDRCIDDGGADALHRIGIGFGRHRLAADMEADAERIRCLASAEQQFLGLTRCRAEFRREAQLAMLRRHAKADAQRQVFGVIGRVDDLLQLFHAVERKRLHAIVEIGRADRFGCLDRVHEAQGRLGERFRNQTHFRDRRDVEMGDARIPQNLQELRRRIRFHGIHRTTRELLCEEPGRTRCRMRTNQRDRLNRPLLSDVDTSVGNRRGGR
ncbi:hypothetical protein D9M73_107810 [compost metagenome]